MEDMQAQSFLSSIGLLPVMQGRRDIGDPAFLLAAGQEDQWAGEPVSQVSRCAGKQPKLHH